MSNQQRNVLFPIFETMDRLSRGSGASDTVVTAGGRKEPRQRGGSGPVLADREDLTSLRGDLRKQLLALRAELGQMVTERECYLVLFPIVLCLDEIIQTRYMNVEMSWPLLQREFFQVDKGGELFYETLDELLDGAHRSPVILEVFYFCLSIGFKGKYNGDEERIAAYMRKMRTQFEAAGFPSTETEEPTVTGLIKPTGRCWWYYAVSAGLIGLLYLLFHSLAADESRARLETLPPASQIGASRVNAASPARGPGDVVAGRGFARLALGVR
jgi:type IV/VI secretion system ImpK/VasF family protein